MYTKKQRIKPFFPLGVFLLPGEDIPLRIFEPRYLQLIEEARQEGYTFVIPYMKNQEMTDLGCEVKLKQVVAESEQGKKVITVEALSLVSILTYTSQLNGKLYPGGNIEELMPSGAIKNPTLINLIINYTEYFDQQFAKDFNGNDLCYYDVIRSLNLSSDEKYRFVSLKSDTQRNTFVIRQINYYMLLHRQEQQLNNDFHLN